MSRLSRIEPERKFRVDHFIYCSFRNEHGKRMCYVAPKLVEEAGVKSLEKQLSQFEHAVRGHVLNIEQLDHQCALLTALKRAHLKAAEHCDRRIESLHLQRW